MLTEGFVENILHFFPLDFLTLFPTLNFMIHPLISIDINGAKEIADDFIRRIGEINPPISMQIQYGDKNVDHFDGPADIIVYFNEHFTELVISSVAIPTIWEGLKLGLVLLWRRVAPSKESKYEKAHTVEIKFKVSHDKTIQYDFQGNIEANEANAAIEKMLKYLRSKDQHEKDFRNPDFKDLNDKKPRIRIRYNSDAKDWEIISSMALGDRDENN